MKRPLPQTTLNVTTFHDVTDTRPKLITYANWLEFVNALEVQGHKVQPLKGGECFSPAEYKEGATRGNAGVKQINFAALDFDQDVEEHILIFIENLVNKGLAVFYYTSHSYTGIPGKPFKSRVCLPFSRPVLAAEWNDFFPKMLALIGAETADKGKQYIGLARVDAARRDLAGLFFLPSTPAEYKDVAQMAVFEGDALDVDFIKAYNDTASNISLLRGAAAHLPKPQSKKHAPFSLEAFKKKITNRQRNDKTDEQKDFTKALCLLRDKEAFTTPDESREPVANKICGWLAKWFPDSDPREMVKLFQVPLLEMEASGLYASKTPLTLELLEDKIRRYQESELAQNEAKEEESFDTELQDRHLEIYGAFRRIDPGSERCHPYTQEEIDGFHNKFGKSLRKLWIVGNSKAGFFIQVMGNFVGPHDRQDLFVAAKRDLAPAFSAGVDTHSITAQGRRLKSSNTLIGEYGTNALHVEATFLERETKYDETTQTLTLAKAPMWEFDPEWDPQIDQWFRILAGKQYPELCAWLTWFPHLDESLEALYLYPAKGVGKSILFEGLSKFWAQTPSQAANIFGTEFNEDLLRCPFVVCDDTQFPKDKGGAFRKFIFDSSHLISQKGLKPITVHGHCRMAFASNNNKLLENLAVSSSDETAALGERILAIEVNPDARDFLNSINPPGTRTTTAYWLKEGIAKHVAFLSQPSRLASVPKGQRGISRSQNESFEDDMAVSNILTSSVLEWLVNYIKNSEHVDKAQYTPGSFGGVAVFKDKGNAAYHPPCLGVRIAPLASIWGSGYVTKKIDMTVDQIRKALEPHLEPTNKRINGPGGNKFRIVKTAHLLKWALKNDAVESEEEFMTLLTTRSKHEVE